MKGREEWKQVGGHPAEGSHGAEPTLTHSIALSLLGPEKGRGDPLHQPHPASPATCFYRSFYRLPCSVHISYALVSAPPWEDRLHEDRDSAPFPIALYSRMGLSHSGTSLSVVAAWVNKRLTPNLLPVSLVVFNTLFLSQKQGCFEKYD